VRKRKIWTVALASAVVLSPYGSVDTLLSKRNPWTTFRAEDPILTGVRIDRETVTDCAPWMMAFINDPRQIRMGRPTSKGKNSQWAAWMPFEKEEISAIEDCHEQPCAIKLGDAEVSAMASTPKEDRLKEYLTLIIQRADAYQKNEARFSYEYPGSISDPWKFFEIHGFKGDLPMPEVPSLALRRLDFHNSRVRPIRQMVDRRIAIAKDGNEATIWIRDVYTNHYFDSWGEWGSFTCDPVKKEVTSILAVNVEFDVLKNTGLFASISRGSARSSMQTLTEDYLERWWNGVKVTAQRLQK
jgi:hypothetical protein